MTSRTNRVQRVVRVTEKGIEREGMLGIRGGVIVSERATATAAAHATVIRINSRL